MKKLMLSTAVLAMASGVFAQAPAGESGDAQERVQYAIILPEEKTPELVKPEENNPFESVADGAQKDEGSSEENQVRDILLRLPAVGGASGPGGMRVMLGGMRLVAGADVPNVLPDQQVVLRVKSITPSGIELVWVDKKPTGLPPKVLVIPMDGAPKVRYRLPNNGSPDTAQGGGGMGAVRREGLSVLAAQPEPASAPTPAAAVAARLESEIQKAVPVPMPPSAAPPATKPPPSNVPEASVLRMLFGNHAPPAK